LQNSLSGFPIGTHTAAWHTRLSVPCIREGLNMYSDISNVLLFNHQ